MKQQNSLSLEKQFLNGSKVNNALARDLTTNQAPRESHDTNTNDKPQPTKFDHQRTVVSSRKNGYLAQLQKQADDDETRSLASEYDYNNKKRFSDIIGNPKRGSFKFE
mmetsp:Transcript_18776/g.17921  ORF Transcript_18776/g.17921 Transcript_18776/m.17921 type:complete len:108 (+) Transcript_18776:176-499(+)